MENLLIEINTFINNSTYSGQTKIKYKNKLLNFAKVLAEYSDTEIEELNLQKIYETYDINGNFINYKPLNSEFINAYFTSFITRGGYYALKDNRDALGSFFNYLNRNYDFPNIVNEVNINIRSFKPKNIQVPILSTHDILKFFHFIVSESENVERDVLLFTLFLTTGMRLSEITNIKEKDIYYEDNSIFLPRTKPNKGKIIPLREGLSNSIKVYCTKNKSICECSLFGLSSSQVRQLFYLYLKKANLPKVSVHSLRHSFATMMVESGAQITEVQQLLGHADLITTKGYVHPNQIRNNNINIKENDELFSYIAKRLNK
ncbi:tyrosine-type recombinase/integrase [Paenisporosarcina sp.]|uniref:tyrosine-type recombinase/integrase n=1 Tax=Paenisporosarcina sp. TaxID=1932001 RepID=UPI003C7444EE